MKPAIIWATPRPPGPSITSAGRKWLRLPPLSEEFMISFLANMASAAVKVVATPITISVDLLSAPFTADGNHDHPMIKTEALLRSAARDFNQAIDE